MSKYEERENERNAKSVGQHGQKTKLERDGSRYKGRNN